MISDHLPASTTSFVGRAEELTEIATLLGLPDCRLLTLAGPGGMGKTRLAIEAARRLPFPTVHIIPLQPLNSPDFLVSTIADVTGFQFYSGTDSKRQLLDYLQDKHWLLVLDNFEHLLEGVTLLTDILQAAPDVKLLVTSRERLNLHEEWVLVLEGLDFPNESATDALEGYSAVQFFIQRARQTQAKFSLADSAEAVIAICQQVEGMPLGLELAATWLRAMSCSQIATQMQHQLDFLTTPLRNVPERHRSLRTVFEQSWSLLSEQEQDVLMRVSVFRGGFDLEAAAQVAEATPSLLAGLVDKSLIRLTPSGQYDLHELLRQFGAEKLDDDPTEYVQTRDRHSTFYADFLSKRNGDLKGRRQRAGLDEIRADFENVRAAWYWMTAQKNYALLNQSIESLCLYCEIRSRFQEGLELFWYVQEVFASNTSGEAQRVWGRVSARWVEMWRLNEQVPETYESLKSRVESSLALARQYGDQAEIAFCLWLLGILAFLAGDFAAALLPFEESFALYSDLDDRYYMAQLADFLAPIWGTQAQIDRYFALTQQSAALRREIGDQHGLASSLHNLAHNAFHAGKYQESENYLREMDAIYLEVGNEARLARNSALRAEIAFYQGNFEQARILAQAAEAKAPKATISGKMQAMSVFSLLSTVEGDYAHARRLAEGLSAIYDVYVQQALAT
ncbi:MAG: hypothetical protein ABI700_14295, partial [Chloroflexota bacterium]